MNIVSPSIYVLVDVKQKTRLDQELKEINHLMEQLNDELAQYNQSDQAIQQELASIKNEKVPSCPALC